MVLSYTIRQERTSAFPLLSYGVSSVKDGIVFPLFHIFARVDRQKRTRILYVWTRIKKRVGGGGVQSLVRCVRGLNTNYALMVYFTHFNNRLLTYPKIYMSNFFTANSLRQEPITRSVQLL